MIAGCILSIALAIISKVIVEPGKPMRKQAIAAIIISVIGLVLLIISLIYTFVILPDLLNQSSEFRNMFLQILRDAGINPEDLGFSWN